MQLIHELSCRYQRNSLGIFVHGSEGYWSNLDREENRVLIEALKTHPARQALRKSQPKWENVIYSPKRQAGLELLNLAGYEICVDYGCMWGALAVPLAKRAGLVLGIDQTLDSLTFLKARAIEEDIGNIELLCLNLNEMPTFENIFDIAIINGVIEWIPETGPIELKSYYGKYNIRNNVQNPKSLQSEFLKKVYLNLKTGGKCYVGIENRYDFKMFLGVPDPHAGLPFTSFAPRKLSDLISMKMAGRPYVNWIYSFNEIKSLLEMSGFSKVDLYMCFPDYRFPEKIVSYEHWHHFFKNYELTISSRNSKGNKTLKRAFARTLEFMIFKVLKIRCLAPSIICIAFK